MKGSTGNNSLEDTDVVERTIVLVGRTALDGINHFET
jgi:hypothetical protein